MVIADVKNVSWERVWHAVDNVRDRLHRIARLMDEAGVAYAVVGGNAVASWVGSVDPSCIRNTNDVDLLVRRSDLDNVRKAAELGGFIYRHAAGIDMLLDGPDARARDAVHILFAEEKVRQEYALPTPAVTESERSEHFQLLSLEALVRMKLTSFRRKDQVHIQDMIGVGLIDETWPDRYPPVLAGRLREILADPNG